MDIDTHTHAHTMQGYLMFYLFEAKFLLSLLYTVLHFQGFLTRVQGFHLKAIIYTEANSLRTMTYGLMVNISKTLPYILY